MTGAPRAGSSVGELALGAAGRMTRRDHHLASRPALVRATMRGDRPCPRSEHRVSHVLRLGGTIRDHRVGHRPHRKPLRSQGRTGASVATAACLELIHQQQVIVAGQHGVIMRGRRRHSDTWPPTREPVLRSFNDDGESDAQTDEALRALVRLLARQAAREILERESANARSNHYSEEGRE